MKQRKHINSLINALSGIGIADPTEFSTVASSSSGTDRLKHIAFSPDLTAWIISRESSPESIEYSDDYGATWANYSVTGLSGAITGLRWINDRFFAGSETGQIITSSDGQTWAVQATLGDDIAAFAYDGTTIVAVGNIITDTGIYTATFADLTTWTDRTNTGGSWRDVCWTGTNFVAVGENGDIVTAPSGGATWTSRTAAASFTGEFRRIVYNSELDRVVAVGGTAGTAQYSDDDGATWTDSTTGLVGSMTNAFSVDYFNGGYLAGGEDGSGDSVLNFSEDGDTWTDVSSVPDNDEIRCIAYGEGQACCGCQDGDILVVK